MGYKLIYAAEVYDDLQQTINWYNRAKSGLGSRFLKAVKEQLSNIKNNPFSFAIRYENVRCAKIKVFPYMVHYKIFPEINTVKITAVFSTDRDPKIWNERFI